MARQDHIDELVRLSLWFDRLKDMGMIGGSGKLANSEACRRNQVIRTMQKNLGITSKELYHLKAEAMQNGDYL